MAHGAITAGTVDVQRTNIDLVPVNPTHASGDTLLCVVFATDGEVTESCSTAGWTAADGITNPVAIGSVGKLYFFQNECDSASEANPTIAPSDSSNTLNIHLAVVLRLQDRDAAANFVLGTVSDNAAGTTSIAFAQNSPSIDDGNAIIAISGIFNDYTTAPGNLSGQAAGLTWSEIVDEESTLSNDGAFAIDYAINDSGSAYTAGTGATKSGSWTSAKTFGVYLESVGTSGATYNDSLSESATGTDSLAAAATFAPALSESSVGAASDATAATFVTALSESAIGSDSISGGLLFEFPLSESVIAGAALAADATFAAAMTEAATGDAVIAGGLIFDLALAESAAGAVSLDNGLTFNVMLDENLVPGMSFAVGYTPNGLSALNARLRRAGGSLNLDWRRVKTEHGRVN